MSEEQPNSINKPLLKVGDVTLRPKTKRSLIGRSGKQFESIDHYVAEALVQQSYPKKNQEDLELIMQDDSAFSPTEPSGLKGENQGKTERTWIQRTCGPLNPGSLRGSIFALMSCALGAGAFALPKALFYNCGFVVGIIFLVGTGILTLFSLNLLMKCSVMANRLNYPDLAEYCFGKWAGKTIQWALIIYVFGVICGYQIIISQFFLQLIGPDWGWYDTSDCDNFRCPVRDIQILIVTFIVLPVSLLRNFYALRHVSIFGVLAIFYAVIVVLAESPRSHSDSNDLKLVHWDWNLFTGYTSALFSFTCFTVVFPIRMELTNPVENRIRKIFSRSVYSEFILYAILAISGYFTIYTLESPADLIIQQSNSYAMVIARIAMILFLFIAIPININPGRAQVINVIKGNTDPITDENFNKKHHILVTAIFLFGPCAIGIFYAKINSVFSFLGGACSTLFGITFPGLMYVKLNEEKWNSFGNLTLIICSVVLTIIGYIAAILALVTNLFGVTV